MSSTKSKHKGLVSRREFLVGTGAVLATMAIMACNSQKTAAIPSITSAETAILTPKYGGNCKLVRGTIAANIGWPADPQMVLDMQWCFETLLRGDNKGNIIPWLAESYKVADDLKSITFALKKGIKFHDGSDFNAEVAKWNLDNFITAKSAGGAYWTSVEIIDGYTIRVNLNEWENTILTSFGDALNPAFMISKAAFDEHGEEWMRSNPVGTGPFKFDSYAIDVNLKFVRNPDYWIKSKPYLETVEYALIADPLTQKMVMESGGADLISLTSGKDVAEYTAIGLNIKTATWSIQVLVPDSANTGSPWANQKVREAIGYAIDREALAKAFGHGWFQASYQLHPHDSLAYNSNFNFTQKYNPETAKQLLSDAGYPDGFKTTLIADPMGERDPVIAIQDYLTKVSIEASLEFPEMGKWINYIGPVGTPPKNSLLFSPIMYEGDVTYIIAMQWMIAMQGNGWTKSPELMQAYQAALASPTVDPQQIRAVTDMISRDSLFVPIYEAIGGMALKPYVMNYSYGERGTTLYFNPEDIWLKK